MRLPPPDVLIGWPTPNYDNPHTRGPSLIIVNIIFIALVLVAVVGRFYARIAIKKWFGIDDWMCVLALIFTIATFIVVILANEAYGWNRHVWELPWDMIESANIVAFVAKLTFTLAATFIRLSLICFYYRLMKDSGIRWFRYVLHASVLWTIAVCVAFVVLTIWLCSPVAAYWVFPPIANSHCLHEGKVMLGGGVVNSVSDLLTTILPIPIVMRLQMPLKQRIGVCILLCLGMIVTIAGSLRTYFTWKSLMDSWDETWYAYPLWIAAAVEIDLGLICSCAPAWKTLLQKPIRELSSKLSSLRTPSSTPNSSRTGKASIFNPLRSLPWFQHTRLDFERTQYEGDDLALENIQLREAADQKMSDSQLAVESRGRQQRRNEHNSPHRRSNDTQSLATETAAQTAGRSSSSPLHIEMRQSFDQSSIRLRERESPVLPSEWLSHRGGRSSNASSPRR